MAPLNAFAFAIAHVLALTFAQEQFVFSTPQSGTSDSCHNACTALAHALPSLTYYTTPPPADFFASYFSAQQRATVPACVVRPTAAQQVSEALQAVRDYGCRFAVKSGGHGIWKGASNIEGGLVIDLVDISDVVVSTTEEDSEDGGLEGGKDLITKVGSGSRWGKVYEVLEQRGMTVIGARDNNVGVGGFLLGGGINFLSNRHGWAMDNVRNYELVLANGSITNVNAATYPDLYWALRGGGFNFGIVTHFDLETFPQTGVWGGLNIFLLSDIAARQAALGIMRPLGFSLTAIKGQLGRAISRIGALLGYGSTVFRFMQVVESVATDSNEKDLDSQLHMVLAYISQIDFFLGAAFLTHSKPIADPPAFDEVKRLKAIYSTNRITNISGLAAEVHVDAPDQRWLWSVVTVRANAEFLSEVANLFIAATEPVKSTPGLLSGLTMQPISQIARSATQKHNDDMFGLTSDDGPLIMLLLTLQWSDQQDDAAINAAYGRFFNRTVTLAKELALFHPFLYSNYANGTQDVFAGYGEEKKERLRAIQRKYDPLGIFSRLKSGCFSI